jgi:hypothetical protein
MGRLNRPKLNPWKIRTSVTRRYFACDMEAIGSAPQKEDIGLGWDSSLLSRGTSMIRRLLVGLTAFAALGSLLAVSMPVEAATCTVLSAKARSWDQATAAERASTKLKHKINRWANKNGYAAVRAGLPTSSCSPQGILVTCSRIIRVCGK